MYLGECGVAGLVPRRSSWKWYSEKLNTLSKGTLLSKNFCTNLHGMGLKSEETFKTQHLFVIAFIIANTFLAYIIGVDQMKLLVTEGPMMHLVGFGALVVFTAVFYGVYARFREQACIVVCPYGRLQGVLLDRNSVVIAYDYSRGEPRAKIHKDEKELPAIASIAINV